jgi:hypothetical protein
MVKLFDKKLIIHFLCLTPSFMLITKIYFLAGKVSTDQTHKENILEWARSFLKKSSINIISPIYFQLNRGKMVNAIAHERTILKVKNQKRFLVRPRTINFSQIKLISISSPFKGIYQLNHVKTYINYLPTSLLPFIISMKHNLLRKRTAIICTAHFTYSKIEKS